MARQTLRQVYLSRRMAALVGLGFASGLPLMLTGRALKVWTRSQGVDLTTVGVFSLVTLPYTLKVIWAPLLDWLRPPGLGRLGRRRGWLLVFQLGLALAIVGMALAGPTRELGGVGLGLFAALAAAVALCGASQDIVADAYRTDVLLPHELGAGASLFTSAYRLAMLASGAGAVFLADYLAWRDVYLLAAVGMMVGMAATLLAPEPAGTSRPTSLRQAVIEPLAEFFARNGARGLLILAFVVLFKIPDQMAGSVSDAFLLDLGFTKSQIAIWGLGLGVAASIPGALVGGPLVVKLGLVRALLVFGLAQALSNLGYFLLARAGHRYHLMIAVVGVEYFCAGLVAAGFIAFLMSQCNKRYSATQFALLTSLMAFAGSWFGAPAGYLAQRWGYSDFFGLTILSSLPGLALLPWLGRAGTVQASPAAAPEAVAAGTTPD